jgi:hypothetical protein
MRFMGLLKADADSEAGVPPAPEMMARMGAFMEEVAKAGVLIDTDGLKPSSSGKRVKLTNGQVTVKDGPFTEAKELVAGYAIFEVATIDDAVYWTTRFLEVLGEGECEVRPFFEASDFAPESYTPEFAAQEETLRESLRRNAAKA